MPSGHWWELPKALIGASIPRSGHHFLQNLLSHYYRDELFYCEVYAREGCCKNVPCSQAGVHKVTYQKSHDRQGELPKDRSDALYVIQYREPVGEALSDRELDTADHLGRKSLNYRTSSEYYLSWLVQKAIYYRNFHDKWFEPRLDNGIYLDYASLSSSPAAALTSMVNAATGPADEDRIAEVVRHVGGIRVGMRARRSEQGAAHVPREIEFSAHFDRALLGAFEAFVLSRCPGYGFSQQLGGRYADHPFYGLMLLQDDREALPDFATDRLDAAVQFAPDHPEIVLRLARRDVAQNEAEHAIRRLEDLIERHPFFAPAYKFLIATYAGLNRPVPVQRFNGDAILACSDSPALLGDLASAYSAAGMTVNATAALSLAILLSPDDFRTNYLLAKLLADERKWAQADRYAERAMVAKPDSKASAKLHARIRKQLERPARPGSYAVTA